VKIERDIKIMLDNRQKVMADQDGKLLEGIFVGDYRIVALLGRGGFAEVYRANGRNGEAVAIKILHKLDDKSRARFARESEILSRIKHRNIPRLLGFGSCGDRPYMVMELLKCCELPSSDHEIVKFLEQIMSAVEELHRHGFIHRDIKPSNILSRDDGSPVLVDFGLAAPISREQRNKEELSIDAGKRVGVGTPGYSAPEQFTSGDATEASDIHALGMLINECFNGNPPASWSHLVERSTSTTKSRRYQSIKEMMAAIGDASDARPMAALVAELLSIPLLVASVLGFAFSGGREGGICVFLAVIEFGLRKRKNWARCCMIAMGIFWLVSMPMLVVSGYIDVLNGIVIYVIYVVSHSIPAILLLTPRARRWFMTAIS